MRDLDLSEAWLRWHWAEAEGQMLHDTISAFLSTNPYMTWVHQKGDRWYWTVIRTPRDGSSDAIEAEREIEALTQAAHLLGNMLDHERAALNYVAYQVALLAIRQDPSLKGDLKPDSVEFPIFGDPDLFSKNNRIKKLPQPLFDRFKKVQPYNGGHDGLWILHEMAREYRHRIIHPILCYPTGSDETGLFSDSLPDLATDQVIYYAGGPLEIGGDLISFRASDDFHPDDYPQPVLTIGIAHDLCVGQSYAGTANLIREAVCDILTEWDSLP